MSSGAITTVASASSSIAWSSGFGPDAASGRATTPVRRWKVVLLSHILWLSCTSFGFWIRHNFCLVSSSSLLVRFGCTLVTSQDLHSVGQVESNFGMMVIMIMMSIDDDDDDDECLFNDVKILSVGRRGSKKREKRLRSS